MTSFFKIPKIIKSIAVKINSSDSTYISFFSLFFYLLLYFSVNNKTLLSILLIFFLIFYRKFKDSLLAFFILFLLFLPFEKGKAISIVLIPSWLLKEGEPFNFSLLINFSDLALFGMLFTIFRKEISTKWKNKRLKLGKIDIFIFGFLFFSFLSIFFSLFPAVSFLAFFVLIRFILIFYVIQKILKDDSKISEYITPILATSIIFQGIWASLQWIFKKPLGRAIEPGVKMFSSYGHYAPEDGKFYRSQGTFDHPNVLGTFSLIILIFLLSQILNNRINNQRQKFYFVSFLVGISGLVFSASRASWLVFLIVGVIVIIFLNRLRKFIVTPLIKKGIVLISLLLLSFLPILILPRLSQLAITLTDLGGVYYRSYLLEKAWFLIQEIPLGIGLATFPAVLVQRFGFFTWPAEVHNLFFEILVEAGIFSLAFFLIFIILVYKRFFVDFKKLRHNKRFLKIGVFFASIGFLIIAQFYPFFLSAKIFEYFWLFMGIMLY